MFLLYLQLLLLVLGALAAPAPVQEQQIDQRVKIPALSQYFKDIPNRIDDTQVPQITSQLDHAIGDQADKASAYLAMLNAIKPTATISSLEQATSIVIASKPEPSVRNMIDAASARIANGFLTSVTTNATGDLESDITGALEGLLGVGDNPSGISSTRNNNPNPPTTIYPRASNADPMYSVDETTLRSAIYIPPTFTYGRSGKVPTILYPGTGSYAGFNFQSNLIKQLTASPQVDPVWINVPKAMLGDVQLNSEFLAYATHYISSISGSPNQQIGVVTFSQGSLNAQWALKYWPSTRPLMSDLISISPDFHGTVLAYLLCPPIIGPTALCSPSVAQQTYVSNFVKTLRSNGGDSAYVPTTTIYSTTDEIVEPQSDLDVPFNLVQPSGFINDARNVGVTNNEAQTLCTNAAGDDSSGASIYLHEGMLYHPLSYNLIIDALTNPGPGNPSRLDVRSICQNYLGPGLGLTDLLGTEAIGVEATVNLLVYSDMVIDAGDGEPAIAAYAR